MKSKYLIYLGVLISIASCANEARENLNEASEDYLIAYNVYNPDSIKEDNYDIFIMEMDGSNKKNITNNPDVAWTYLAFDDVVFFISDRDTCNRCIYLYSMDAQGRNVHKITDFRLRDSWMSIRNNGNELIVTPAEDSAFYVINRQGQILEKIYSGLPLARDPVFSPNGKQVAFSGGNRKSKREEGYMEEIYIINIDGSGLKQLSRYPENDSTAPWYAYKAGPPKWHPTENFISYASFQNGKYSLYAVSPDGSQQWKLTENPQDEVYHSWSPDGKWLTLDLSDNEQTQFDIGLMNWKTGEMKILTGSSYHYQQAPVFVKINGKI